MSDRQISVGDMVVVVRGCDQSAIGLVFKVARITHEGCNPCMFCKGNHDGLFARSEKPYGVDRLRSPLWWLKRIPPLSELEGQRTQEDLREPA